MGVHFLSKSDVDAFKFIANAKPAIVGGVLGKITSDTGGDVDLAK